MNSSSRTLSLVTSLTAMLASASAVGLVSSCGSSEGSATQGVIARNPLMNGDTSGTPNGTDVQPGVTPPGGTDPVPTDLGEGLEGLPVSTDNGPVQECASSSQPTQLQGVTLVFAFDVSASMASDDNARMYKWEPVALAAKTFFSSPNSTDVSAQLTFFPSENSSTFTPPTGGGGGGGGGLTPTPAGGATPDDSAPAPFPGAPPAGGGGSGIIEQQFPGGGGGGAAACTEAEYAEPDIPLTTLPSDIFGTTIDATEPNRLGTPTRWALPAVIDQAIALRETNPSNYAVVLVTDGLPTDCNARNDSVAGVAALAAVGPQAGIPVYVIGVDTPEGSLGSEDDSIANLNQVAVQGGTEAAFIIDTGDVDKTIADFVAVIEQIKESTFSCTMPIPPPPTGQAFDATKVNVAFKTDTQTDMVYSPDCAEVWGWHYDNEAAPTAIVLCDTACTSVKSVSSQTGSVDIQFGCERRVINK